MRDDEVSFVEYFLVAAEKVARAFEQFAEDAEGGEAYKKCIEIAAQRFGLTREQAIAAYWMADGAKSMNDAQSRRAIGFVDTIIDKLQKSVEAANSSVVDHPDLPPVDLEE